MSKNVILSHPTGNANVREVLNSLVDTGLLAAFYTSIASFPNSFFDRLGRLKPFTELNRRQFDVALEPYVYQSPWRELARQAALKAGFHYLLNHETGVLSVDALYQATDRRVASRLSGIIGKKNGLAIYAYEDGALHSFRQAKTLGIPCLYDLPIGHWRTARELLTIEQERWPDWAATLTGFLDSPAKLARKDEELRLADQIFVASSFTAQTLQNYPGVLAPIRVVPYGFPPIGKPRTYDPHIGKRPLRILFVGGLSQRKGIADLFAAVDTFHPHVELTIAGRKTTAICSALDFALAKHRWIPSLPHSEILQLMRQHDVLAFPSLFEGFGLVITEAMSQGTPVITTERTAGPDQIRHGENGWLTKAGNVDSLRESIENLLNRPELLASIGREAQETAKQRPWSAYGHEMAIAITEIIQQRQSH